MRDSLSRQRQRAEAGDHLGFSAEDADFHAIVVRTGQNPLLEAFYISLRDRQRRMTAQSVARNPERLLGIIADHERLVDLVEAGRIDEYDARVFEHMARTHGTGTIGGGRE